MLMERPKPVEAARDIVRIAGNAGRYALHQMGCSAWAELGDQYGQATGGYRRHPASIQFYTTGEPLPLEIPENIILGVE